MPWAAGWSAMWPICVRCCQAVPGSMCCDRRVLVWFAWSVPKAAKKS